MWIYRKRWELAKNVKVWLLLRLLFANDWNNFDYCMPWLWPKFSRSQTWNGNISETVRPFAKCVTWLLPRWIIAIKWHHCEYCTSWSRRSFSRSNILLLCIWYKEMCIWRISPADLHRRAWPPRLRCSCFVLTSLSWFCYFCVCSRRTFKAITTNNVLRGCVACYYNIQHGWLSGTNV